MGKVLQQTIHAVESNCLDDVQAFIDQGGDVNSRCVFQSQLIHYAARFGRANILALLLENGADVNSLDYGGMRRTPLHWACQNGHVKAVETLVAFGADTNARGRNWAKLVQGQMCGSLVPTEPCEESPRTMCQNETVALALEQPQWCIEIHHQFPRKFKELTKFLLLVSSQNLDKGVGEWPLDRSLTLSIMSHAAYPISTWVDND